MGDQLTARKLVWCQKYIFMEISCSVSLLLYLGLSFWIMETFRESYLCSWILSLSIYLLLPTFQNKQESSSQISTKSIRTVRLWLIDFELLVYLKAWLSDIRPPILFPLRGLVVGHTSFSYSIFFTSLKLLLQS